MNILKHAIMPCLVLAAVAAAEGCSDDETSGAGGSGASSSSSGSSSSSSGSPSSSSGSPSSSSTGATGGEGVGGSGGSSSDGGAGGSGGSGGAATGGAGGAGGGVGGAGGSGGGAVANVVINEVVSDPLAGQEDWIEFYNAGNADADIAGWSFTDDDPTHVFTFPAGTMLAAGAYLVLTRNDPDSFTFGLGQDGDQVNLFDATSAPIDTTTWTLGQADEPNSWARLPNGTGAFDTSATPTKGTANN